MADPTIKPFPNMLTTYVNDSMRDKVYALKRSLGLSSDAAALRHLIELAFEEIDDND